MKAIIRRLSAAAPVRRALIPFFAVVNPGDVTIRHHYTGGRFRLHSFRHKGYWFHGKRRESETMRFFAGFIRSGDTVVEIGGHIGYVSVYLSKLVEAEGRVYVLEPGDNNLPYLRWNTGKCPNVTIIEKGAADRDGLMTLYMENLTGQNNSFVRDYGVLRTNARSADIRPDIVEKSVPVVSVDGLVRSLSLRPSLIKIDVEGFESQVLHGMSATLAGIKPALMIEVTRDAANVFETLRAHGYVCFDRNGVIIEDVERLQDNIFALPPGVHRDRLEGLGWTS